MTLSGDQATDVYGVWSQDAKENATFGWVCRCQHPRVTTLEYLLDYPCPELRYDQRRAFQGAFGAQPTGHEKVLTACKYDAIPLVVTEHDIMLVEYEDGKYCGINQQHYDLYITGHEALYQFVTALVSA